MKVMENLHLPVQKCLSGIEVKSLSDIELLAVVLNTGNKNISVLELASKVYLKFRGLPGLSKAGLKEISQISGIGRVRAVKLRAAIEMGKRSLSDAREMNIVDSPIKVWKLLLPEISGLHQEEFRVLMLNTKNNLIRKSIISIGTISETLIHPREIFREAVKESAASIIIVHNHPSGDLTPSKEDIETTERILKAGKLIGIPLLDHLILSDTSYYSMQEQGYIR
ncbi:MAG: DNA repair protein RadC [Spirochaetes bacterium]|nr:DNA repair protein RadC [Spirochaetota bacterium]